MWRGDVEIRFNKKKRKNIPPRSESEAKAKAKRKRKRKLHVKRSERIFQRLLAPLVAPDLEGIGA